MFIKECPGAACYETGDSRIFNDDCLNVLKNLSVIGGRNILDSEDFIVSNILLPLGSLIFLLFCVSKYGWGADRFLQEANTGKGIGGWEKNRESSGHSQG